MKTKPFQELIKRVKDLKVFKRNKKPIKTKILAALTYQAGLSYRSTAWIISFNESVSHVAVRDWYRGLKRALPKPKPKYRNVVAVDETKCKLNGKQVYVWAAIDVETKEVLATNVTKGRSSLEAYLFLKKVLKTCLNKPKVLVDRGPWYCWALRQLRLRYELLTFGLRNGIERFFGFLKERTKRFYNNIVCRNLKNGFKCLQTFLNVFTALHNWTRPLT
jgi:transposase-like protein